MHDLTIHRVLEAYGFGGADLLPVQKGYRNESHPARLASGTRVNVILYKDEPGIVATIQRVHEVSLYLARQGFPVRYPLDERIMQASSGAFQRYLAVYNYLPGRTIAWEAYSRKHLRLLGKTMSDMHAALSAYSLAELPDVADQYLAISKRMLGYFADPHVTGALSDKLGLVVALESHEAVIAVLRGAQTLAVRQPLHMDFVRSNILFEDAPDGPGVSGIIDFEKIACGHPFFDIARTLAFLFVDCKYKTPAQVYRYFFVSGYQKHGAHHVQRIVVRDQDGARPLLDRLVDVFLLHDFYKFLRHNPYESLSENEHFVRTRDLLCTRGVISTTS